MQDKFIEIYNTMTKHDENAQDEKLNEEYGEFIVAFLYYRTHPNRKAFLDMLEELIDMLVVVCGKAIVQYRLNLGEIWAMFKSKVNRTHNIAKEMKKTGKSYEEIRRSK